MARTTEKVKAIFHKWKRWLKSTHNQVDKANSGSTIPAEPDPSDEAPSTSRFPGGIEVLHDCSDASVDICFIHGLTGNRDNTWTGRSQRTLWPKTLLPLELPRARILTFGYDAYIAGRLTLSSNRLIDHATSLLNDLTRDRARYDASSRPLIFVTHSLGGLVCKEAILLSRNNPEAHLRGIFECTKGIVFMGTPHKGSWMADWARIPASAFGLVKLTNKPLLESLETDGQFLESIQVRFWSMVREVREAGRRLEVTCFFEELPLPVVGKVVSKESATLEGYSSFSIHANHSDMVKFDSAEDNGYERLVGELVRWESQIGDSVATQPTHLTAKVELDRSTSNRFSNTGSGPQNIVAGSGDQNNNFGNGPQVGGDVHGGMHFG
ncbi:hypothetical protein FQN49_001848 [Arthroderma sp. PD_2]|nr:hypothetical protein FQN49_001848 [Arthroderma sp. PD_2]